MNKTPLVSIVVITYNSSKFVLDTLESCAAQSYHNLELIISDDCSTDETVNLCKDWIRLNSENFISIKLIEASKNTGIPANCNRGVKAASGEWIKLVAGDDVLDMLCISNFMGYCHNHTNAKIIASIAQKFHTSTIKENYLKTTNSCDKPFFSESATAALQYKALLRHTIISAPSVFINRHTIINLGGFNEKFKFMEDRPFWLKATRNGVKIHFLCKTTVFYRIHDNSAYSSFSKSLLFSDFYKKLRVYEKSYIYPELSWFEVFLNELEFHRKLFLDKVGLNKNKPFAKFINNWSRRACLARPYISFQVSKIDKEIKKLMKEEN